MTTRARILWSALAIVMVGLLAWAMFARSDDDKPGAAASRGVTGMEGMNMTGDGTVALTAGQITQFGITFGTVDVRILENEIRTVGIVSLDETRIAQVAPKVAGFAERLHVNFTGQPVRRGQPLLDVYSPDLVAAQYELLVARRLEQTMNASAVPGVPAGSSNLLSAARQRLRLWDISDGQIDRILRSGTVQRTLTLHAPAGGVVIEKSVVQGQAIQPGQTLYTIANLSEVWVEVEVREADIGRVREGSSATLDFAAFPARTFRGRVEYIYPTLTEGSRTLKARISVANSDGQLKPGMYATVRITTPAQRVLSVPISAVIQTGERSLVFVDMGGGQLMSHEIQTGRTGADFVEVLSGVEPGQRVVTSAQFLLDSESNLAEVMKSMIGQMAPSGTGRQETSERMPGMDREGMDSKGADMKGMKMPPPPTPPRR